MTWGRQSPAVGRAEKLWPETADLRGEHPISGRTRHRLSRCPEVECVRYRLSPGVLAAAELRAAEVGTGADQVLVTSGVISEEAYAHDLCRSLNVAFEPLERVGRDQIPLDENRLMQAVPVGMLPIFANGDLIFVITLHGLTARHLVTRIARDPTLARRVRITTSVA